MFTALTLCVASSFDVKWVPTKLAEAVMGVSMEGADHEMEQSIFCLFREATVLKCLEKCTTNIVGAPNLAPQDVDKMVDKGEGIFRTSFHQKLIIQSRFTMYSLPLLIISHARRTIR